MSELKRGKLYITNEDILNYMGLSKDTYLDFEKTHDGLEINVIANGENEHDWLTENVRATRDLRRARMVLNKYVPSYGILYKFYEGNDLVSVYSGSEAEALKVFNEQQGEIALVKEEMLGYKSK